MRLLTLAMLVACAAFVAPGVGYAQYVSDDSTSVAVPETITPRPQPHFSTWKANTNNDPLFPMQFIIPVTLSMATSVAVLNGVIAWDDASTNPGIGVAGLTIGAASLAVATLIPHEDRWMLVAAGGAAIVLAVTNLYDGEGETNHEFKRAGPTFFTFTRSF